jgi:hypothetical protein
VCFLVAYKKIEMAMTSVESSTMTDILPAYAPMEPLRLMPLFEQDDNSLISADLPRYYMIRQPSMKWWTMMEEIHENVPSGTRILIRKDIRYYNRMRRNVIHEYISTRVERDTLYGRWIHHCIAYTEEEGSPYPYDVDAFRDRDSIITNYNNLHPRPVLFPVEINSDVIDPMDVVIAERFVSQLDELSSRALETP